MADSGKDTLLNLGRPTLRGVRKCPKCGMLSGTRGNACKNKQCDMIFKVTVPKVKEPEMDVVRVISNLDIYSVKINLFSLGSGYPEAARCFVHVPFIEGFDTLQDLSEVVEIKQSAAVCYAPKCRKPARDTGTITVDLNPCDHIINMVNCYLEALPLPINKTVLRSLQILEPIKELISLLMERPGDHAVQRLTKTRFVVACQPSEMYPLGYLHFSVFEPVKNSQKFKVICQCQEDSNMKPFAPKNKHRCMHFYMCICAFCSNSKLVEEFKPLITSTLTMKGTLDTRLQISRNSADEINLLELFANELYTPIKRKNSDSFDFDLSFLEEQEVVAEKAAAKTIEVKTESIDDSALNFITFENWLASVTERINETMHFQLSGTPQPLEFFVPQTFFDVLAQRLSVGASKRKLPSVEVCKNSDSLPIGGHTKTTYTITNIIDLKKIFDTQQVLLQITRSFKEKRDGTFVAYEPSMEEKELINNFRKTTCNKLIKPLELRTFLKVGKMLPNQKSPLPFIIEWLPNVLPKTQTGKLSITFQFGHQRNGVIENRDQV